MNKLLTGSDAVAKILQKEGVRFVFAYPGTSELVLCNAFANTKGIRLINGRGDKESAFMAAGGSLIKPLLSVALLHGARGSTNAMGAICDAQRNEINTLFIVGLPSTQSMPFLPPHGERDLIQNLGNFAKKSFEIKKVDVKNAQEYVRIILDAILCAKTVPNGPVILGIPQDALEKKWIPQDLVNNLALEKKQMVSTENVLDKAVTSINNSLFPVILIDDFLFKVPNAEKTLLQFTTKIHAPIFQIWYKRGPMMFQRLHKSQNPHFIGSYDVENKNHAEMMERSDLLITIEDRNAYERIIGKLPNGKKLALTSNPEMTRKNNYLKRGDVLIEGNVVDTMMRLMKKLPRKNGSSFENIKSLKDTTTKSTDSPKYQKLRNDISGGLAQVLQSISHPVLVDDSQMFGGLLFEQYEEFPEHLRVFGDHGAFIGGGVSLSAGLALCNKNHTVFCTLGDQSCTNALQGFISAVQENINITYIVCNNGKSVSLIKQFLSQYPKTPDARLISFLKNPKTMDYSCIADVIGLQSLRLAYDKATEDNFEHRWKKVLSKAASYNGPSLIELVLPSDPGMWEGIWSVKGNETK